eukprot:1394526-Prymnesium_polylepis.1
MPSVQPRTRYTAAPSPPSKTVSGDAHRIPGERRIYACRPKTARRSPSSPRARRAASCLQLDDRLDGRALESNLVDALEERELVLNAAGRPRGVRASTWLAQRVRAMKRMATCARERGNSWLHVGIGHTDERGRR